MAERLTESSNGRFGPFSFEETNKNNFLKNVETKCLLCEDIFNLNLSLPLFLSHIFDVHNVVIEEVCPILAKPFQVFPLEQIVPSIDMDSTGLRYFLLSTLLKEDKELRHKLRLDYVLTVQEYERKDKNYVRPCLFCRLVFEGSRPGYLDHLSTQHNLQLGNPQNLVYIEELVEKIDKKIAELKCLYCEKTFTDRNVLKEHMRKKLHKRINPQNTEYDKYYIVNYLEEDKSWRTIQREDDRYALPRGAFFKPGKVNCLIIFVVDGEANTDEEYSDWNEPEDQITCLFCRAKDVNINLLCLHMEADHDFDFVQSTQALDFYQKIKLVNYVRRQTHDNRCFFCDSQCEDAKRLERHLMEEMHCKMPELSVFDQPEFYFPTYENDAFLYFIDDVEEQ
ncbi:hypothetical protein NQ318_015137 [Aromia moschata]|uniref:C2H2-type domain-containing protein n=1 Tax=Aromia moschata TaxID=1265417 RepID=A0AAV8YYG8_9CUCU|nr:hypothetical protein NQ318_015137 [Aromia moschata]